MRHQDWPERLNKIISESHNKPFAWGEHDCCLFAANVVFEITGVDHAAELRGTYKTALQASRALQNAGGVSGIASAALGKEINPLTAQRGDVVLLDRPDHGETLAICIGVNCTAPGENGLQSVPMAEAVTAWRVE
jgi:hypothetical protein